MTGPAPIIRRVSRRSIGEIAAEWDQLAEARTAQLDDGIDISYFNVLMPAVLRAVGTGRSRLLDVGCGTGVLTQQLAEQADVVIGIDPSRRSIDAAVSRMRGSTDGAALVVDAVETYAMAHRGEKFDAVVANMTLMDSPDLDAAVAAVGSLLSPGGIFVWTITHPWFWPKYWGYESASWFTYQEEIFIEAEFRISNSATGLPTTHIHRPLERYIASMRASGMIIQGLNEPMPSPAIMSLYPTAWSYPRFLVGICRLDGSEAT